MRHDFKTFKIPFLYYQADNTKMLAGHKRIFGDRPGKGWVFYEYNQVNNWSMIRRWHLGLFTITHAGVGDRYITPPGWYIDFVKFKLSAAFIQPKPRH